MKQNHLLKKPSLYVLKNDHLMILAINVISGKQDPKKVDARLICPLFDVLFPYLPENWRKPLRFGVVHKGVGLIHPS